MKKILSELKIWHRCFNLVCMLWCTLQVGSVMAVEISFYDAALCQPPYSKDSAEEIFKQAEELVELGKADASRLTGQYIYKLPNQIGRDGFESDEVILGSSVYGVLIKGLRAKDLAAKYQLKPEQSKFISGYMRILPVNQQPSVDEQDGSEGKVSIVVRENRLLNQTLLACEFISDVDRKAFDATDKLLDTGDKFN